MGIEIVKNRDPPTSISRHKNFLYSREFRPRNMSYTGIFRGLEIRPTQLDFEGRNLAYTAKFRGEICLARTDFENSRTNSEFVSNSTSRNSPLHEANSRKNRKVRIALARESASPRNLPYTGKFRQKSQCDF